VLSRTCRGGATTLRPSLTLLTTTEGVLPAPSSMRSRQAGFAALATLIMAGTTIQPPSRCFWTAPSEYDLGTDNVTTVTGWIQQAVANKMWVIILWHRVDETDPNTRAPNPISVPSSVIQGVVNYIVQNGVHVVTDSEGLVIENLNAQQ
jgi:hypothetical protein